MIVPSIAYSTEKDVFNAFNLAHKIAFRTRKVFESFDKRTPPGLRDCLVFH